MDYPQENQDDQQSNNNFGLNQVSKREEPDSNFVLNTACPYEVNSYSEKLDGETLEIMKSEMFSMDNYSVQESLNFELIKTPEVMPTLP